MAESTAGVKPASFPTFEVRTREYDGLCAVWVPRLRQTTDKDYYYVEWENTIVFDPLIHEMSTTGILLEKVG